MTDEIKITLIEGFGTREELARRDLQKRAKELGVDVPYESINLRPNNGCPDLFQVYYEVRK